MPETATPKIFSDMIALRKEMGGLQAKKGLAPYPVKSAKELYIKLRAALDVVGMSAMPVHHNILNIPVEKGTACLCTVTYRFISSDGSFVDMVGSGHGADDRGDKAAGKASTYAAKDAISKGCCLPDAEMVDTDDEQPEVTQVTPMANLLSKVAAAKAADLPVLTAKAKEMGLTKPQAVEFMAAVAARKAEL